MEGGGIITTALGTGAEVAWFICAGMVTPPAVAMTLLHQSNARDLIVDQSNAQWREVIPQPCRCRHGAVISLQACMATHLLRRSMSDCVVQRRNSELLLSQSRSS